MERMDHLEHLDKHLVDELAQVARETIREEVREQTRKQRRTAVLYASSGALALYAGAAVSLAVGLAFALVLPDWAAALITAAVLGVLAYVLRGAARPHRHTSGRPEGAGAGLAAPPVGTPAGGLGMSVPPMPSTPPDVPRQGGAGPDVPNHRV
ncbi:phage holin family protein [Streptomyces sp. NPDC101166]|uniref:phage holin family protein n=1 Tax=Streptomyces sp. NPDC101166 TaxID=3366120 RepID=UPI0037FBEF27